jgi:murein L,D-transpeptidase YcbB/YkuD
MKRLFTISLIIAFACIGSFAHAESSADKPIYLSAVAHAAEPKEKEVHIVINIPSTTLTLYENGKPRMRAKVAVGSGIYPTPEDKMTISHIEWNPWWIPPPSDWAKDDVKTPPGPGNPLGIVKLPMQKAVLLHGTNARSSVGRAASHGCMRMYNEDAKALAWYLQSNFSDQNDPALLEKYKKFSRRTFYVKLNRRIPVDIIYDPVGVENAELLLFPDYYNKTHGRRFDIIINALTGNSISRPSINDDEVRMYASHWPRIERRVQIHRLTHSPEAKRILALQPVDEDARFFH